MAIEIVAADSQELEDLKYEMIGLAHCGERIIVDGKDLYSGVGERKLGDDSCQRIDRKWADEGDAFSDSLVNLKAGNRIMIMFNQQIERDRSQWVVYKEYEIQ